MFFSLIVAAGKAEESLKVEFGWLALILPVAAFAIACIVAAFTAEDRVRRECHEQAVQVRDATVSQEVRPTLGAIIVLIHPYMKWPSENSYLPGEPGDPGLEAARILGYRQANFSESLGRLEEHYLKIHQASSVHDRRVEHAQRRGLAMGFFLIAWLYLALWLSLPDLNLPVWLSVAAVFMLALSSGWAACEWWNRDRENNRLSILAREARELSGGETS